jgi:adenine-specific DNA-methyltransferase
MTSTALPLAEVEAGFWPELNQPKTSNQPPRRLIHYLGSKLRLLGPIEKAIAEVTPYGGIVCDLFAGSGTVSAALASRWSIVASDIQEYSRVLCDALLNPPPLAELQVHDYPSLVRQTEIRWTLIECVLPLMEREERALEQARQGDARDLCDLLDEPALVGSQSLGDADDGRDDVVRRLRIHGLTENPASVVTTQFGGAYFSWRQAVDFDALLSYVHRLDSPVRDYLLAAALATASDVVNTVGKHFAQPIRPRDSAGRVKQHLVRQIVRDRGMDVLDVFGLWLERLSCLPRSEVTHTVIRRDYRSVLTDPTLAFDVVYADPPYTRDHYSRYYHVLETMALHDLPSISTTMIRSSGGPRSSRGMYRSARHQSPFSIKSQAPAAFAGLFRGTKRRGIPLVLSYSPYDLVAGNRPRLMHLDDVISTAQRYFSQVEWRSVEGSVHNKLNVGARNIRVAYDAEALVICRP